jgi:hypothetical protein
MFLKTPLPFTSSFYAPDNPTGPALSFPFYKENETQIKTCTE